MFLTSAAVAPKNTTECASGVARRHHAGANLGHVAASLVTVTGEWPNYRCCLIISEYRVYEAKR